MSVWHSMATCRHAPLGPHAPWGKIGSNDKWSSGALMGQAPRGRADGWAGCWAAPWAGAWCWQWHPSQGHCWFVAEAIA